MIISLTPEIIQSAKRGTIECPVYLAAKAAGLDVSFIGVGTDGLGADKGKLIGNIYLDHNGEAVIQPLPNAVNELIRQYDKTGQMEPFDFELPDLA